MTLYEDVFNGFKDLVIRDEKFFKDHPQNFLIQRMLKLMKHAITEMLLVRDRHNFEINFMDILDDKNMCFTIDLTPIEIDLLSSFMWQVYINEEVVMRLKQLKNIGFSDDEIKFFSPAESMKTFNATFDSLRESNCEKVREYKRRGRLDFKIKTHNFLFDE